MDIKREAFDLEEYAIDLRRQIHENPELSDKEEETVALICRELTAAGIDFDVVPGGGVLGYIDGAQSGKTVLLRADIDALPIQEDTHNMKNPQNLPHCRHLSFL